MFDVRRITLFCLEKRFSKHKMTIFSKNLGRHGTFGPPGYAYGPVLHKFFIPVPVTGLKNTKNPSGSVAASGFN